ncbi:unnamed protein product [Caenorhabditis angaria]|uniref:Palmitoyltransferase n=1 Tax=Caenorhabditis angaria TaxID=860376 RepID=A0A9P1NB57_9PELO|nr:unnamed protein product [Caenorhabditis angaria]
MDLNADPLTHTTMRPNLYDLHSVIAACQHGDAGIVEEALKQGLSPNTTDDDGCALLHWASINNKLDVVKILLSYKADPNIIGGILKSSPIHWAARNGHVAVCAVLVKAGAICNTRDTQGYTPVHLAIQGSHVPLVAYFLLKFDYAKDITDNSGMTPAMWCAYRSFTMFPLRLIVKSGADLSIKEHFMSNTALHIAVAERNYMAVTELLAAGADVSIRNKQQETPIDLARSNKNPKILDAIENAAQKQGLYRSNCIKKLFTPPFSTYFYFFLPALLILATWYLFSQISFLFATILTMIACIFAMVTLRFDFHDPRYKLIPYGVTIAEASLLTISWSSYAHWYVPWWAQMLFVLSIMSLAVTLFRLATIDPGVVKPPKNCHQLYVNEAESGIQYQEKYCFTCFVRKMQNTKHCAVCDHCVSKFDHHCPWLHSCITRKNMREFILFILSVVFSSAIYFFATLHYMLIEINEHGMENFVNTRSFLLITLFLSAMHAIMLTGLFAVQINQISLDVTTNEVIKTHRSNHSHSRSRDHNVIHQPISLSARCHNLLEFCSSNGEVQY